MTRLDVRVGVRWLRSEGLVILRHRLYCRAMSFDQVKAEASGLPLEERKALIGHLLALGREERDVEFKRRLAQKIDDKDPSHWVAFEDLAKHLDLESAGE
jgi:hypothetical protein